MTDDLKDKITQAIKKSGFDLPECFDLTVPPEDFPYDYATNVAMVIAGTEKINPKTVAEKIVKNYSFDMTEKIEIAGGGFINIKQKREYFLKKLAEILESGENYGRSEVGKNKKVNIEFISANPTGPLHIGNARGGPIGEVISNVLSWLGWKVEREFYLNDTGNQILKFGQTLAYWYILKNDSNFHFPEGGYPGDFLKTVSEEIQKEKKAEISKLKDEELVEFFIRFGLEKTIRRIKEDIILLGINFDKWVYESDFLNSGKSFEVVEKLSAGGHTSKREGALWFTSNDLDPNDRETVLLRSDADKTPTYFATDVAYHKDKFDRASELLIDVWGATHHGHIARVKSALKALSYNDGNLKVVLYQNVRLKKDGEVKLMGKRLGNYINIVDLLGKFKVSPDVFKYMIISQSPSSVIDFDLELAIEQSEKNPVYYLQYAYARICSILQKADAKKIDELEKIARGEASVDLADLAPLKDKKELDLIKVLTKFDDELLMISGDFQIQALPHFATEVASKYHDFYSTCQVLSEDRKLTTARLLLILATRNVLKISLTLMGISAPEKM